jgi:Uma2 family endonuclease
VQDVDRVRRPDDAEVVDEEPVLGDCLVEVQQNVRDYLEAGARLVWVVAPQARSVTVYRADASARLVREPESLDGENVLPGFSMSLADLFA